MTLTADHNFAVTPALGVVHMLGGRRLMMRLAMRIGAVAFALVVLLIWIAPGAVWDNDVLLFKLALSVMAFFGAVALWQRSLPPVRPSVEVDIANMEVRVMRRDRGAQPRVIEKWFFADLESVDLEGRHIIALEQRQTPAGRHHSEQCDCARLLARSAASCRKTCINHYSQRFCELGSPARRGCLFVWD
jgi:hypothetical protein